MYNDSMPYIYTHAIMGLNVWEKCEKSVRELLEGQAPFFLLGTMGPDPYFGDALPPPVGRRSQAALGDRLHGVSMERLFAALLPLSQGEDRLFCYTLGFLCHVLLDNHTHPYIMARFPGDRHTPAEIAMDPVMVRRNGEARYFMPPGAFYGVDGEMALAVDRLHAELIWKLFALRTQGAYRRSLKKWLRVCALQFDPKGTKARLLKPFPTITSYLLTYGAADDGDLLNLGHKPWGAGAGGVERSGPSFIDLFDAACGEARQSLELAVKLRGRGDYGPLAKPLAGRSADAAESL